MVHECTAACPHNSTNSLDTIFERSVIGPTIIRSIKSRPSSSNKSKTVWSAYNE